MRVRVRALHAGKRGIGHLEPFARLLGGELPLQMTPERLGRRIVRLEAARAIAHELLPFARHARGFLAELAQAGGELRR